MIRSLIPNEYAAVLDTETGRQRTKAFLTNIFHLFPEERLFDLLMASRATSTTDRDWYITVQNGLAGIKPFLADLTYALPSLSVQKKEMIRQTIDIPGFPSRIDGYAEIGSPGRYVSRLRKHVPVDGDIVLINETEPSMSPVDIAERGGLRKIGRWLPLDYSTTMLRTLDDHSYDVVTCYIGLHHAPVEVLTDIVGGIRRILRPGGIFVMRDHDVTNMEMATFVSFAHTVFNIGTGVSADIDALDTKIFRSANEWSVLIGGNGFRDSGIRTLQKDDPTLNTLLAFIAE